MSILLYSKVRFFMFAACDECGYNAATKGMVAKHVQTVHRKEKPFECEICRTR